MYVDHRTGDRLPSLPDGSGFAGAELADFENALALIKVHSEGSPVADARNKVDGQPYCKPYFTAFANAPSALMRVNDVFHKGLYDSEGCPGSFSAADHEFADLVVCFDSGYWGLLAGHGPNALASGIRIEAIEALESDREEELTADERQVVNFIRTVRDGGMTDDLWQQMVDRLGTLKGTIEFAVSICIVLVHHRMMWVLGVPAITREDWREMMEEFKSGRRDPALAARETGGLQHG